MRKQLLTTTALVAAGMMAAAAPASAQKKGNTVKLGLKGYMEQVVGFAFDRAKGEDISDGATGSGEAVAGRGSVDIDTESEIHFKGSGKLDNGITVLADVQLEVTGSPGNVIDEQYLILRGNFGQVILGSEDNAGHLMTIGYSGTWATGVGQNLTFDSADWIHLPVGVNPTARFDGTLNDPRLRSTENDSNKVSYFTPRFEGFQLGASYIPKFLQETSLLSTTVATKNGVYHEGWALGANFDRRFDQVRVGVAAGYLTAKSPGTTTTDTTTLWKNDDDMKAFSIGGRLDFGGFRVSAVWKHHEDVRTHSTGASAAVQTSTRSLDGDLIDVGARYIFGANAVSLGYRTGEMEAEKALAGDEEEDAFMASFRRTLGPGVNWTANLIWADVSADGPKSTTASSNDGWAVTSSIRLIF